jgi:hypothetical protein
MRRLYNIAAGAARAASDERLGVKSQHVVQ